MLQTQYSFIDPKKIHDFGNNANMKVADEFNETFQVGAKPASKLAGAFGRDTSMELGSGTHRTVSEERSEVASTTTKVISLNDAMN